jgi:hypothetical protein
MDHADIKPMVPPPPTSREHQAVMNAVYSLLPDLQARIDAVSSHPHVSRYFSIIWIQSQIALTWAGDGSPDAAAMRL